MKIEASERDLLVETLVEAGIGRADARKADIIDFARVDAKDNERVHAKTNSIIFDLLQTNSLGRCIHVTGGARALTDPYHRKLCEAIRNDDREPFKVLYHVPENLGEQHWGLVAWNLKRWGKKGFSGWRQKIMTLRMIGGGGVDLKAYDERERIQYSVFGHRYAQIQSKHADDALAKFVWLINSEKVTGHLEEVADADIAKAKDIDESVFDRMVSTLFSNAARALMFDVLDFPGRSADQILHDPELSKMDGDLAATLEALKVMEFIDADVRGLLSLTRDGRSFVDAT